LNGAMAFTGTRGTARPDSAGSSEATARAHE
jgi:hypothetical protein